ncbi:Ubiquitin carboxyl-terminal hydrolase 7 [Trypanosoma melophagium]|uniref:Ubiquitin carboxyl-terminal hydrolase 7 n=1 Tax=Trypanosoma melophagium TaxID=715481 RepID=UPI00351A8127|nr:Ubiquitin carboxyl-terminal hydrolase 7 [Trypanosoma melophagium]
MLNVLEVVRHVFWDDALYDRKLLPPEAALERCQITLADLATMTGAERIAVFEECGIHNLLHPVFLRALQRLTAIYGSGAIDDNCVVHRHLSAQQWSPFVSTVPLLGYSFVNSAAFKNEESDIQIPRPKGSISFIGGDNKPKIKYNGLLNQGATCYLNSLLQSLFHISEFRLTIYQMPTLEEAQEKNDVNIKTRKSIPYALQRLFCLLQRGNEAVDTTELTESFGWSSTDSFVQHDVHEMTCELLDNLENKLNQVNNPEKGIETTQVKNNAISRLFVGVLESFVRVDEVNYYGAREELFYDLQLVVKNTTNIYMSLDKFFQVEVLDGKNKYCLESDGKKSYHRAEKGVRLKLTPPIMLLHLTRFDYDLERGESKVLSRWDYYNELDLSMYMPHASKNDTHYTLCSVLVHSGSNTGFGHYFCFLRCSNVWYRFNDEIVSPASLRDVFGANFGGVKVNYWGSEVPNTTNAYMLVYIRTSEMNHLLRRVGPEDVPWHVVQQLEREHEEYERLLKERAEDHLYGRICFIQPQDIVEDHEFLSSCRPRGKQFPSSRTFRVLLSTEALPEIQSFVEKNLNIPTSEQSLWYTSRREKDNSLRLHKQITSGLTISDILSGEKECCVLVINSNNAQHIEIDGEGELECDIYHHKLYIPLQLKVVFLGCTVVHRKRATKSDELLQLIKPFIRNFIVEVPDENSHTHNHHLTRMGSKSVEESDLITLKSIESPVGETALSHKESGEMIEKEISVLCECEHNTFSKCPEYLKSGDILVWQEEISAENKCNVFYPNVISFQHFLRHRIPVEIKLNMAPTYPTLINTQLAEDMTYEQLQRYVGLLIGDPKNYDRIRFTMYNLETKLPYFMKGTRKDRPTLLKLLSPPVSHCVSLLPYLYYEYCKYTVTEIEAAHSLQFKLFSERVKPMSEHWILMPRAVPITPKELFSTCINEIQNSKVSHVISFPTTPIVVKNSSEKDSHQVNPFNSDALFYSSLDPSDGWKVLRLVDVWLGRIYNVFDKDHPHTFDHSTFEESAEYRIEQIPRPIEGVPLESQSLIQVHHFTMVRQRTSPVETHGDPFSIYIGHNELAPFLLQRIACKLGLSEAAVVDWKMTLVKENSVVEIVPTLPMGKQLFEFCDERYYQPNQPSPNKMAFLGLEHAPLSKRSVKKEDKVVILN